MRRAIGWIEVFATLVVAAVSLWLCLSRARVAEPPPAASPAATRAPGYQAGVDQATADLRAPKPWKRTFIVRVLLASRGVDMSETVPTYDEGYDHGLREHVREHGLPSVCRASWAERAADPYTAYMALLDDGATPAVRPPRNVHGDWRRPRFIVSTRDRLVFARDDSTWYAYDLESGEELNRARSEAGE